VLLMKCVRCYVHNSVCSGFVIKYIFKGNIGAWYYIAFLLNIMQLLTGVIFIQDSLLSINYISAFGMYFGGI
jgi:hypothetical protein